MKRIILIFIILGFILKDESLREKFLPFASKYLKQITEIIDTLGISKNKDSETKEEK